jgi:CheY-like chemotaxis protein
MEDSTKTQPSVLVINDDKSLLNSRRMLLEDCGAKVFTARGVEEAIRETLHDPVDLVVIDVTNVGLEHGVMLCDLVKGIHPSQCVALLVKPEMGLPSSSKADRVIFRTGPRKILVEINEMLDERLDLNLWNSRGQRSEDEDEDFAPGE